METGEKEMRKIFEDVTTRNVITVTEYSKETRKGLRDLQAEIRVLKAELSSQRAQIEQFKIQLAGVQTKLFSGGTA